MSGGIKFFLDENVDAGVRAYLLSQKYLVNSVGDGEIVKGSADEIIAAACADAACLLVTHNYKDFEKIAKAAKVSRRRRNKIHRIELNCAELSAVARIGDALSVIEHEWQMRDKFKFGLQIRVTQNTIRIYR